MALSKKENIGGIVYKWIDKHIDVVPESPWRNRSIEENLQEFEKMRRGEYKEGDVRSRLVLLHRQHCE